MQFLEATQLSVRSAVYHLTRPGSPTEFILFPMVHVGAPAFYEEVARRLEGCDLILAEGIRSLTVSVLTSWYAVIERTARFGLVTQHHLDHLIDRDKVVNADMSGGDFDTGWGRIPLKERLLLSSIIPVFALYLRLFGTKEMLARRLNLEDLPSREEELRVGEGLDNFYDLIVDQRDAVLLRRVNGLAEEPDAGQRRVAVVYGARHMRSITKLLLGALHYRVASAEWRTVFPL